MKRLISLSAFAYGIWFLWNATETYENWYAAGLLGVALVFELIGNQ
jgi:hypothetical protein